jgi:hypothetical protein
MQEGSYNIMWGSVDYIDKTKQIWQYETAFSFQGNMTLQLSVNTAKLCLASKHIVLSKKCSIQIHNCYAILAYFL